MAAKGKSAEKIQAKTGVTSGQANRYASKNSGGSKGGGGGSSKPRALPNAAPKHGVNKQNSAQNHYDTQNAIRGYADQQNAGGLKIGDSAFGDHFDRDLSDAEQRYMYDYAGTKGYGIGDDFAARYKDNAEFVDNGDPARPYKPGGFRASMVDGGISKKEIQAAVDKRGKGKGKEFNENNAFMRIANRWSQKGGALSIGAAKNYTDLYSQKNPFEAAHYNMVGENVRVGSNGMTRTIEAPKNDMSSRAGQQGALFRSLQGHLKDKSYAKGDVFSTLKNGDSRALPRVGNTGYMNQFTGGFDKLGIKDLTGGAGAGAGDGGDGGTGDSEEGGSGTDINTGMTGGLGAATGENNLGFKRKQSSMASSGRNRKGTGIAARSGFKSGLSIK